jgi:hypothetical protein
MSTNQTMTYAHRCPHACLEFNEVGECRAITAWSTNKEFLVGQVRMKAGRATEQKLVRKNFIFFLSVPFHLSLSLCCLLCPPSCTKHEFGYFYAFV